MNDSIIPNKPKLLSKIETKSKEIGFAMPSDLYTGSLLKTLVASKPGGNILELGTGIGLSLTWMADGLDSRSKLITVDNDPELIEIAKGFFGTDDRVQVICRDGAEWIREYSGEKFDLIFADARPGKYSETDEALNLLKVGGFYVIDDMSEQPNWPEGHQEKAETLIAHLENRNDLNLTKMNWSTGIIICTKKC